MPRLLNTIKKASRIALLLSSAWLLVLGASSLWTFWQLPANTQQEIASTGDWGAEALQVVSDQAQQLSPIAIANACGLGASSCFRCHNASDVHKLVTTYSALASPVIEHVEKVN